MIKLCAMCGGEISSDTPSYSGYRHVYHGAGMVEEHYHANKGDCNG